MASIKILGGDIPKQTASYLFGILTIKGNDKKSQTYVSKEAIKVIEKVSEHKKSITFKVTLKDETNFLGTASRKVYDSLVADQMTSAQSGANGKMTEYSTSNSQPSPLVSNKEPLIDVQKEKSAALNALAWFGAIILILLSFIYWGDGDYLTAISFLGAGLVLSPLMKKWMPVPFAKKKGWIVFGLIILGSLLEPSSKSNYPVQTSAVNTPNKQVSVSEADAIEQAEIAAASKKASENENYINQINREIELLSKPVSERDKDTFKSIKNMQAKILSFAILAGMIRQAETMDLTEEQNKRVETLRTKVVAEQRRVFPKMRDKYGPLARQALWENDIHVRTTGNKYSTITYSWHMLAANKNKQQLYNTIFEELMLFRFKEVRMSWYKGQDEFTYWKIPSKDDGIF